MFFPSNSQSHWFGYRSSEPTDWGSKGWYFLIVYHSTSNQSSYFVQILSCYPNLWWTSRSCRLYQLYPHWFPLDRMMCIERQKFPQWHDWMMLYDSGIMGEPHSRWTVLLIIPYGHMPLNHSSSTFLIVPTSYLPIIPFFGTPCYTEVTLLPQTGNPRCSKHLGQLSPDGILWDIDQNGNKHES